MIDLVRLVLYMGSCPCFGQFFHPHLLQGRCFILYRGIMKGQGPQGEEVTYCKASLPGITVLKHTPRHVYSDVRTTEHNGVVLGVGSLECCVAFG